MQRIRSTTRLHTFELSPIITSIISFPVGSWVPLAQHMQPLVGMPVYIGSAHKLIPDHPVHLGNVE